MAGGVAEGVRAGSLRGADEASSGCLSTAVSSEHVGRRTSGYTVLVRVRECRCCSGLGGGIKRQAGRQRTSEGGRRAGTAARPRPPSSSSAVNHHLLSSSQFLLLYACFAYALPSSSASSSASSRRTLDVGRLSSPLRHAGPGLRRVLFRGRDRRRARRQVSP